MLASLPPACWLLLAAPLVVLLRSPARSLVAAVAASVALLHAWAVMDIAVGDPAATTLTFLGYLVQPVAAHAASPVFATIFCLMALVGILYSAKRDRPVELAGALVYAGGALGVIFAGDWLSLFAFWEIMTLGSTTVIFSERSSASYGAAMRYFGVHVLGGLLLLAGIAWLLLGAEASDALLGDLGFLTAALDGERAGAAWLILIGMLINAGAPPLSAWIADAYPSASASGTVWLSTYTTKTAIFTLLTAFAGLDLLLWVGMVMACYGIVYAVLENDFRRILAYSIVNQVGFMVCGVAMADPATGWGRIAVSGVCAQAFAHIAYKGLLLMSVGAVIQQTGRKLCSEVGGLYRSMPLSAVGCIIGVLAMSGFPFTAGYTTKSMLTAASFQLTVAGSSADVLATPLLATWFVLQTASVTVFLVAGLKVCWFVFFGKDSGLRPQEAPSSMLAAMAVFAVVCLWIGLAPQPLYGILPFDPDPAAEAAASFTKHHYGWKHLAKLLWYVVLAAGGFLLLLPLLKIRRSVTLDVDWLYRRAAPLLWQRLALPLLRPLGQFQREAMEQLPRFAGEMLGQEGDGRVQARVFRIWGLGAIVLLMAVMLCAYLLLHYYAH